MLFNSPNYIFIFLPIVLLVYFLLNRRRLILPAKAWLVLSSLFFYGYWKPIYLFLIISSMLVNFSLGTALHRSKSKAQLERYSVPKRKSILLAGVTFNLGLLAYFKYADFFLENLNLVLGVDFPMLDLVLPLAISFFTFQQIAYLVDSYKTETREYDFLNYCLFVTFFPQLIAGPIVHHREMMPQFQRVRNALINWSNIATGMFIFALGLFKKVAIADSFSVWANSGYAAADQLTFFSAWATSLSYTFQLYYDFSGYSDMAIGAALMFNIRLPINFHSPYKARNIQDFWRRWHITLSRWLRDYIYIPLGGSKRGRILTYRNVLATFLLGGLWHGAGWNFIIWGGLHGLALVIFQFWSRLRIALPGLISWFVTFMFVNATWVFFRATTLEDAIYVLKGMAGISGVGVSPTLRPLVDNLDSMLGIGLAIDPAGFQLPWLALGYIFVFGAAAFFLPNGIQMIHFLPYGGRLGFRPRPLFAAFVGFSLFYSVVAAIQNAPSEFLYFNF